MPLAAARGILYRAELISRILSVSDGEIIYLGSASPPISSGAPGAFFGTGRSTAPASPCSRWGLPGRRHCCPRRCALTAPFHPRIRRCNLLSVALAVRLPCPAVNRHRRPMECGLSSTGTGPAAIPAFNPAILFYSKISVGDSAAGAPSGQGNRSKLSLNTEDTEVNARKQLKKCATSFAAYMRASQGSPLQHKRRLGVRASQGSPLRHKRRVDVRASRWLAHC